MTFEIVREDGVVVFKEEVSRVELEKQFLLVQRMEHPSLSYVVYTLDEDLNRVGRKKKYIPYENDTVAQAKFRKQSNKFVQSLFSHLFNGPITAEIIEKK